MFVLGTAGHVDHGKSTLITRLTGIDPDRLAEEKARGLTIDLGFAWMTLPSGREVGIVDVPGHERFVHNMLAGAGQVDAVVFVVDANEGWRTQSEEHLAILDLLGVRGGVVALTKADVARDVEATRAAVTARLRGTVLDGAPVVACSAVTGEGIEELLERIDAALDAAGEPEDRGRPRLFVDRAFSIKGAGTVVTGTLTGGRLREDDDVLVLPSGVASRIRQVQTHRAARAEAVPTSRVAINLAGVDRDEVRRGDAVVKPEQWMPTTTIDVELRGVRSLDHPVTSKGAFLLYAGTAEVRARMRLIDAAEVRAGGSAFARLTLHEPVVAATGDRFVLRDTGRRQTVAGGRILDAHPLPGRVPPQRAAQLTARSQASAAALVDLTIDERGILPAAHLFPLSGASEAPDAIRLPSFFASPRWMDDATDRIEHALAAFHTSSPLERGMPREQLRRESGIEDAKLFGEVLAALAPGIVADGAIVRLAKHSVTLGPDLEAIRDEVDAAAFQPPSLRDLGSRHGPAKIKALLEAGLLVRVADDLVFAASRLDEARERIAKAFAAEGGLTASRIKDLLDSSRKYVIPLLEHFDASGFTRRDGDVRTVV